MTTRLTVPADVVLNLTVWAREHVEHPNEAAAWDALERDALMLINCDVYVEEDGEFIDFLSAKRARVTGYETRKGWVNVNEDSQYVYLDPYVDVEVEGHGLTYTYGRTHQWRKATP
jgi:hypothetical protein